MNREVKPYTIWRHFKGFKAFVITVAKHTETGENLVVYYCFDDNDKEHNNEVIYCGARPKNMNLWAIWLLQEDGTKIDIIVKTIFRGEKINHTIVQERIRIKANGEVEQRYKNIN